jgi:hypothetical protein
LLDNAYDFLNNSLYFYHLATHEDYPQDYKRYWKFSIVDIVQAMELMFKEVLRRENEIFIYENIDKPNHTVSISKALQRLINIIKIDLNKNEENKIKQAIEIRNQIIHFELELDLKDLSTIYIVIFEFLHSFHYRFLGEELHEKTNPEYWEIEALIMEQFEKELVLYSGIEISKMYAIEIAESQLFTSFKVQGIEYKRIKFGDEQSQDAVYNQTHCGDCAVKKGYFHALGCDLEICPKCGGQAITCSCNLCDEFNNEED